MPVRGFAAGSNVTEIKAVTYALKEDPASGAYQLVRAEAFDPAQPVLDHVVKLEFRYFGDPLPPRLVDQGGEGSRPSCQLRTLTSGSGRGCRRVATWRELHVCTGGRSARVAPDTARRADAPVEIAPALLTDGPWCPDAGARNRFDADLLRIRRVRFTLRVQTALASLRGPAGMLFTEGGTARAGGRYVPDLEIQLDVTPRNLNLGR